MYRNHIFSYVVLSSRVTQEFLGTSNNANIYTRFMPTGRIKKFHAVSALKLINQLQLKSKWSEYGQAAALLD